MQRRSFLGAGIASALTGCSAGIGRSAAPTTLVLVHGAWRGAWCWERVTPLLAQAGLQSVAVSLPGMGERRAELSTTIDLESHVEAVVSAVLAVPGPVCLVGHSYAGFVITGAADRLADARTVRSMIYVDAFVPPAGERVADYMSAEARTKLEKSFARGDPAYPAIPTRFFGIDKPDDTKWAEYRLTAQPAGTYLQPLRLVHAPSAQTRRSYIGCQSPRLPVFDTIKARVRNDPAWTYRELQTGHDAMITAPVELTRLMVELA